MKKENRQMAQQRRAEDRARLAAQRKRKKILMITIPILLILILAAVLAADYWKSSSSDSEESSVADILGYSDDPTLTVKDGDMLHIDYTGTIDGVEFAGGSTDGAGAYLVVGSGSYIDDFEEQLIGSHPGDEVEVNVTFPEDYSSADLAGKDAVFMVTVNGIYE